MPKLEDDEGKKGILNQCAKPSVFAHDGQKVGTGIGQLAPAGEDRCFHAQSTSMHFSEERLDIASDKWSLERDADV